MVALAPVLVRIVGRSEVYLTAEIKKLLAQHAPELQALGHLQLAGVERYLEGGDQIALRHPVGALRDVGLIPAGYGDGPKAETLGFEEVSDGPSHARVIHDQLRRPPEVAHPRRVVLFRGEPLVADEGGHLLGYLRVRRPQGVALQVSKV